MISTVRQPTILSFFFVTAIVAVVSLGFRKADMLEEDILLQVMPAMLVMWTVPLVLPLFMRSNVRVFITAFLVFIIPEVLVIVFVLSNLYGPPITGFTGILVGNLFAHVHPAIAITSLFCSESEVLSEVFQLVLLPLIYSIFGLGFSYTCRTRAITP